MKKNNKFSEKLRQEREGAENTLRFSFEKKTSDKEENSNKKNFQRKQIRKDAEKSKTKQENKNFSEKSDIKMQDKKIKKPLKPTSKIADSISYEFHSCVNNANEDDNAGVKSAHFSESIAEGSYRLGVNRVYSKKLKNFTETERFKNKETERFKSNFTGKYSDKTDSNPYSKARQKKSIKNRYMKTKTTTKKGAKLLDKMFSFTKKHHFIIVLLIIAALMILIISGMFSSCAVMFNSSGNLILASSYTAEDEDIIGANEDYIFLEDELRDKIENIETTHPGYDEYRYELDEIYHDPYELTSLLTVKFEDYTRGEVQAYLEFIFDNQYELEFLEEIEIRTRTETRTRIYYDPETDEFGEEEYEVEVEYEYKILNVTLKNYGIKKVAYELGLTTDEAERFELLIDTKGNRDYLFGGTVSVVSERSVSNFDTVKPSNTAYTNYAIPGTALTNTKFRKIITEAEKYLGYPYVWGGSNPSTSFDCSGFVSWVINNCGNGWNVGRRTATGLMDICEIIPQSSAKPGDLIFFQRTYDTNGVSHVGIYVGNDMMIHCGSPISYTSLKSNYWQEHYYCTGRIK